MKQVIVRLFAGFISVATAFSMNFIPAKQHVESVLSEVNGNQNKLSLVNKANVHDDIVPNTDVVGSNNSTFKPILQTHPSGVVRQTSLPANEYGVYWGNQYGIPAFFESDGTPFVRNAKGVIDVSEHQNLIDWNAVKASGVDGAIIRIGYGWDNGYDKQAIYNINECKRLGIPFGIYLYSYAEKPEDGASEGVSLVKLLRGAGVSPSDLTYPVYYDLEKWTWAGHEAPTSPYVYQDIVASWWNQLVYAGYTKLGVYSYSNYLRGPLNSHYIHNRTSWVASYGSRTGYNFTSALRGWQYTSSGNVAGINGSVDLNAFGMADGGEINGTSEFGTVTSERYNIPAVNFTWIVRDSDIAVGASVVNTAASNLEYRWLSYNLTTKQWETISDWTPGNWASWVTNNGDYWLHCEVRVAGTNSAVAVKTIAFHYSVNNPMKSAPSVQDNPGGSNNTSDFVGNTVVSSTYAGWRGGNVLLGAITNNPNGYTIIKIYDYNAKQWISQFRGPWALWNPKPGIYWTHFEAYSSDGTLKDTKTYAFKV